MRDIWNPWHGCTKISEGCQHCYMYFLDKVRDQDGSKIYKTKNGFNYPLQKDRQGEYLIKSGETISVCMTSDFFLEEADIWRDDAWAMIKERSDVKFLLITKRIERVKECLPHDWGEGWENVFFNVTCENQKRADERLPILLELPFKHKGVYVAPMLSEVNLEKYLEDGQIMQVVCGGENYDGVRPLDFEWVKSLRNQCKKNHTSFYFVETGTTFIKDGRTYNLRGKGIQKKMAFKANMNYQGRKMHFKLTDPLGLEFSPEELYKPIFCENCMECSYRGLCNGCSQCGKCYN